MPQIWLTSGVILFAAASLAQGVLSTDEVASAKNCIGTVEARSSVVDLSPEIVVAVLADTIRDDDFVRFRQEFTGLYQALKDKSTVRLALIYSIPTSESASDKNFQMSGPYRRPALLKASLDDMAQALSSRQPDVPEPQALTFYSSLGSTLKTNAAQFVPNWSTLVLVGRWPVVDPELADYAKGWLAGQLHGIKSRVSYRAISGEGSTIMDAVVPATGGAALTGGLAAVATQQKSSDLVREVNWEQVSGQEALPKSGIQACPVALLRADGTTAMTVPAIVAPAGVTAPDLGHYAIYRERTKSLAVALKQTSLSPERVRAAEADLSTALEISPRDEQLLRMGSELFRRSGNDVKLSTALSTLIEFAPGDAALFSELGHTRFRLKDWDGADRALLRARELKTSDGAAVAEELARIRLLRNDDAGALPYLEERLASTPVDPRADQELWLLRADGATRLNDWQRTADSLEHAFALGELPGDSSLTRRTALVRLYMSHKSAPSATDHALFHIRAVAEKLPVDAALRAEYAGFLDELKQEDEALPAWKRTLEADPKLEQGHYRVTRLLIDKNALPESLAAAENGIQAAPKSARLYLAKSEILEKQDQFYEARRTLRTAAPALPDHSVIARLAEMEDAGGQHAARYYRQLAEQQEKIDEKPGVAAPEHSKTLERGLAAALRDNDLDTAAWFKSRLPGAKAASSTGVAATVIIPGGLEALGFVARTKNSSSERFLVEYARATAKVLQSPDKKTVEAYTNTITDQFRRVAELSALGTPGKGRVTVTISGSARDKKKTEKVLELLGWKMRTSRQGIKLEAAEKGDRASHHETASALAIDEIGMQKALEGGKAFSFEIVSEPAEVILGEEPWRTQFYAKEKFTGGLAEAIAGSLELAQLYAALGQMDPASAAMLVSGLGLKTLAEKYAVLLYQYSSALAAEKGRVTVPGGEAAEAVWTSLAGANPRQPAAFFRALLQKDSGKLLAFYAALSELDIQHQRFFTLNSTRAGKFYSLFKEAPEIQGSKARHLHSGTFTEFLAEVPLTPDGKVDFPGSAEVWMVAKGQSRSAENVAKLMRKVNRSVASEVEDEILLRLAGTTYKQTSVVHSELDNFLAVVGIDAHRSDSLDEVSALLLAQHFASDGSIYPYFAVLTGLEQEQFERFFAYAGEMRSLSEEEKNLRLAPLYSLLEILCLAQQSGALKQSDTTQLFGVIVERLQKAPSQAERNAATLDLVNAILSRAARAGKTLDDQMRELLLGSAPPVDVNLGDEIVSLDPSKTRHENYRQVLEMQKVPSLTTLFAVAGAVRNLGTGKGPVAESIQILEAQAPRLLPMEPPKELKLTGKEREAIEGFDPRRLQRIVDEFKQKTARKKINPKDLEKLAQEYWEEMGAPIRWAVSGVVYAYFLRPDDLLVSEDPLLLRKHRFEIPEPSEKGHLFEMARLSQSSDKAGSFFTGGFADFADAAGVAAARGARLGTNGAEAFAAKQVSALRLTDWSMLRDEDFRLFGLKLAVAREWIVRASNQPALESALAESTLGVLSLTRRAGLRSSLATGDWRGVWNSLTLSDIYFLADRYLQRYASDPWESPATLALRKAVAKDDGARLQWLGAQFDEVLGCSHPHLWNAAPYETYEKHLMPTYIAERSSEFKLYLARLADADGIPAAALGAVADKLAQNALKRMQVTDYSDWRSVLKVYESMDVKMVREALAKP